MAILVPGSTADQGWNYSAKEGADLIECELKLGAPVSFVENVQGSEHRSRLRDYGREGYALVICHGYEFHEAVKEVAGDFTDTTFVISGYDQPHPAFGSIVYQLGEGAYLCGVMAANVTQSGHVGFLAAMPVPPVKLCYDGFREGFLSHRLEGTVRDPVYIEGSKPWEDSATAKVKTQAMLQVNQPAAIDVLFQNADAASRGIFEAVEAHPGRIFVFGANRDQNASRATSKVLASAVIHVDRAFLKVARSVRDGVYQPHVEAETVASGVIDCVLNPRLADRVGDAVAKACRKAVATAREALLSGQVDLYGE